MSGSLYFGSSSQQREMAERVQKKTRTSEMRTDDGSSKDGGIINNIKEGGGKLIEIECGSVS